ncbi:DUF1176 domain-containing protein [Microcystis sp. M158S2]|uniref:DUF1176 domain-containing protein n=1 Tax=Microcystis sp. M158S2 TaxID=2771152 RepID=UPI0025879E4E|nr:DUF1176 domain-containing protein [Microcystis sp. M158S2]MCA2734823.1 hypothetical protein [Microcystis sp. M158S2]
MRNKILTAFLFLICCNLLLSCVGESNKYANQEILPTSMKTNESKELIDLLYSPMPVIGTTDELGKDMNCEQELILAYAETEKFRIYLCGNDSIPVSLVIIPMDRNSRKIIIKETPLKIGYSYRFKQGVIRYTLRRPSPTSRNADFIISDLSLNKTIIGQHVSRYLFNKQINPDYKKSFTQRDKQAKERFLKFLPDFRKQYDTCHFGANGLPPKGVSAYKIDSGKYLVEMLCLGGGNNAIWQYVLYSEYSSDQQGEIIKFETLRPPKFEKIESEMIVGYPHFFPEDNRLTIFSKGSGSGLCGSFAEYKLVDNRFELQEFRDKSDCSDRNWQFPEEYPKIYP